MRKVITPYFLLLMMPLFLTGCNTVGDKTGSIAAVYLAAAVLSLLILAGYLIFFRKKDPWYLLLFASVFVVNTGYFLLAISNSLEMALHANRLAYLGSVFLPLAMWMIILNVTCTSYRKWLPVLLFTISVLIFLIAASPGYLDIYYQDVSFTKVNGVAVLQKEYGPLHILYLIYLLGYFAIMVISIIQAAVTRKLEAPVYSCILMVAVAVNIGVWLIEQLVHIDFEILSISYIISECFLLGLNLLIAEHKKEKDALEHSVSQTQPVQIAPADPVDDEKLQMAMFTEGLSRLTPKERQIYDSYIQGMTTAEIMEKLQIKENTLKFHNKNLYGKLGVSSRKQLVHYAALYVQKEVPSRSDHVVDA